MQKDRNKLIQAESPCKGQGSLQETEAVSQPQVSHT